MNEKLKMREKLAYALGDVGGNFVWTTISMFLTLYYTDSVGISAGVVGTIMLFTRLFDGVTDLAFGSVIDRTNTKMGKARPWILRSTPLMAIGLILLFNVPNGFSENGKIIYAVLTYVFVAAIAYTISGLSYSALLSLITEDSAERASISSIRFLLVTIIAVLISSLTMPMVNAIGWRSVSVIYAVLSVVCFLLTVFGTKERVVSQSGIDDKDKMPVLEGFKCLFKNRYFYSIMLLFIVIYMKNGVNTGIGIYYLRDVMGNENLMALFSMSSTLPLLIGFPLFPVFVRKFGKWKCMMAGAAIIILASAAVIINPYSIPVVMISSMLSCIASIPLSAGLFALVADGVTYGEWKNGVRQDGLFNSATSFGTKVGTGLGTAILGWGLELGGYQATAAVQSAGTIRAIIFIGYGIPIICMILGIVFLSFSNIDKIYPQIEKDLAARRSSGKNGTGIIMEKEACGKEGR